MAHLTPTGVTTSLTPGGRIMHDVPKANGGTNGGPGEGGRPARHLCLRLPPCLLWLRHCENPSVDYRHRELRKVGICGLEVAASQKRCNDQCGQDGDFQCFGIFRDKAKNYLITNPNKKAELSQIRPRDAPNIWVP